MLIVGLFAYAYARNGRSRCVRGETTCGRSAHTHTHTYMKLAAELSVAAAFNVDALVNRQANQVERLFHSDSGGMLRSIRSRMVCQQVQQQVWIVLSSFASSCRGGPRMRMSCHRRRLSVLTIRTPFPTVCLAIRSSYSVAVFYDHGYLYE
jgi:hypothetical protein